jgi:hypothetical protein
LGSGNQEAGSGNQEAGSGKRESGSGKREAGSGKRESGRKEIAQSVVKKPERKSPQPPFTESRKKKSGGKE